MAKSKKTSLATFASQLAALQQSFLKEADTLESIRYSPKINPQDLNVQVLRYHSAKQVMLNKIKEMDDIVDTQIARFQSFEQPAY